MRRTILIKLFVLFGLYQFSWAQQVSVQAGFVQDSARIGDRVDFFLTARYPSQLTVLFPDSTFNFAPFDFSRKKYFPTRTRQGESYDSVVYELYAFEVAELQRLTLPIFVVQERDCTRYVPPRDSLVMVSLLPGPVPDTVSAQDLPLKVNTFYQNVTKILNYPLVTIVLISLLILAVAGWLIFGKRIRKHYRVKKLIRNHNKFMESFTAMVQQIKSQFAPTQTETALSQWKKYLEELEQKPYTKLTTRETIQLEQDEQLGKSLHLLDKAIYGNYTAVYDSLQHLQQIAESRFIKKLAEVKRG